MDGFEGKRDLLVRKLRTAILNGTYMPGEALRQKEIADRYHASSTPVREALRILEAQGLVHHEAYHGVTVADISGSVTQLYRLREALECLATEMSVENMTPERGDRLIELAKAIDSAGRQGENAGRLEAHTQFHLLLFEGADFPALKQMIDVVWARFPFTDLLSVPGIPSAHDHFVIADLARAGDVDGATEALRMHLRSVPVYFDASLANRHPVDSGAELVANRTIAHPRRFRYVGGPGLPKR